jgi:hypothetical protein
MEFINFIIIFFFSSSLLSFSLVTSEWLSVVTAEYEVVVCSAYHCNVAGGKDGDDSDLDAMSSCSFIHCASCNYFGFTSYLL